MCTCMYLCVKIGNATTENTRTGLAEAANAAMYVFYVSTCVCDELCCRVSYSFRNECFTHASTLFLSIYYIFRSVCVSLLVDMSLLLLLFLPSRFVLFLFTQIVNFLIHSIWLFYSQSHFITQYIRTRRSISFVHSFLVLFCYQRSGKNGSFTQCAQAVCVRMCEWMSEWSFSLFRCSPSRSVSKYRQSCCFAHNFFERCVIRCVLGPRKCEVCAYLSWSWTHISNFFIFFFYQKKSISNSYVLYQWSFVPSI